MFDIHVRVKTVIIFPSRVIAKGGYGENGIPYNSRTNYKLDDMLRVVTGRYQYFFAVATRRSKERQPFPLSRVVALPLNRHYGCGSQLCTIREFIKPEPGPDASPVHQCMGLFVFVAYTAVCVNHSCVE